MKKLTILTSILFFSAVIFFTASSFKSQPARPDADTCSEWAGHGIQFRQCANDWGLRWHQFYNGYSFQIRIHADLTFTDGGHSGTLEIYIDPNSASDKAASDGTTGVNKVVDRWTIMKKERKNDEGKWVDF